jgi:hypothetical protein
MYENNFEKQVREKMDQLGFDPSDQVWAEVDKKINLEKKKRRPLFWIFLFSGLMLAGGGMYVLKMVSPSGKKTSRSSDISTSINRDSRQESKPTVGRASSPAVVLPEDQSAAILRSSAGNRTSAISAGSPTVSSSSRKKSEEAAGIVLQQTIVVNPKEPAKEENSQNADKNPEGKIGLALVDSSALVHQKMEKTNQAKTGDSVSILNAGKNDKHQTKTSPWAIGFSGSAGISNIDMGSSTQATGSGYLYAPANINLSSTPPVVASGTPAELHAGFSFGFNATVYRKISKRISLSAGLGYRYYSTTIHTGNLVDSTLNVYTANNQTTSVSSFYPNGSGLQRINQYQFIELPVNFDLHLNKSINNPVIWEAGFSLNWMVASNALLFDPYSNVYYKNRQSFNTTQWDAATSIMVGFPVQNHSFQLGPQLQYGLTGLLKIGADHPGHLYFIGLKMTYIP